MKGRLADYSQSAWARYGVAVVAVAVAVSIRLALDPLLRETSPFTLIFVAVLASAWYGGFGPGLTAAVLGLVAAALLFQPQGNLYVEERHRQAGLLLYLGVSLGIAWLGGAMQRALQHARQQADAAQAQREELRITLHSIGDAVIATDSQGRVAGLNAVAEKLTGWPPEEAVGQPLDRVFRIVNEATRAPVTSPVERVLRQGQIVGLGNHTLLIARDGRERPIDDSAAPILAADGTLQGVVLVFRDVADRRASQRRLEESEQRFRSLADSAPVLIWMAGPDKGCNYFNQPWLEFTGRRREEELGDGWASGVHPDDRERCLATYTACFDLKQPFQMEYRLRRHDGEYRWLLSSGVPRFSEGAFEGYIGSCIDITERKQSVDALRERELRYRYVSRAANDVIWDWDLASDEITWNEGLQKLFGYAWDEVGLTGAWWKGQIHPDDRQRVVAEMEEHMAGGGDIWTDEYRFRRGDGGYAYVVNRGFILRDADGRPVRIIGSMLDQTDRRRAEEQVRESAERLELALEAGKMGTWDWSIETGSVTWSPGLEEIHGLAPGTFPGTFAAFEKDIHPDDRELVLAAIRQAVEERRDHMVEYRLQWADGSVRWVEGRGKLFCDEAGHPKRMVGVCIDITHRKRLEEQLQWRLVDLAEAEARSRSVVDHVVDGLITIDARGVIESFNPAAERTFGWTAAEVIGRNVKVLMPEPYQSEHDSYLGNYLRTGERKIIGIGREVVGLRKDGGTFPMDLAVSEFRVGEQRYFTGIVRDITERKRQEQIDRFLADASAALAHLVDDESTLAKVASLAVPFFADWCAIDMLDDDGNLRRMAVAHVDPAKVVRAHELHRRFPPDPGAAYGVWQIIRGGRAELVPEITEAMLTSSIADPEHLQMIRELGLKSYMAVPLHVRGKSLGAITFIAAESGRRYDQRDLAAAEDLARRAAVAIENAQLYDALREADRRKDEFLAVLAHELRNPLAPIRNALHILKLSGNDPETADEVREIAERQVEQLTRLVDDLLDVSRIMRGRIDLRREPVELATIVSRAVEMVRPAIDAERHELSVSLPNEPLWLDADVVRLSQVVANLLSNAAKYTEPGGKIWITARRFDGQAEIAVRDTGIGIAPDMLPRLFQMFVQAAPSASRSQGGLGIGLTLVKNLVELQGGTVEARSEGLGRGSEFVVRLPVAASPEKGNGDAIDGDVAAAPARRILVVDDNVDAADSLAVLLRLQGHDVRVAHGGQEALTAVADQAPEIVLLDIGMPGMNGYEVARRLRADYSSDQLVLVALTGWGQDQDRQRSREAGFDHHLTKPVDLAVLDAVLANHQAAAR